MLEVPSMESVDRVRATLRKRSGTIYWSYSMVSLRTAILAGTDIVESI